MLGAINENCAGCAVQNKLERVEGIEPSYLAWKATALPLSYTRIRYSGGPIAQNKWML